MILLEICRNKDVDSSLEISTNLPPKILQIFQGCFPTTDANSLKIHQYIY